MRTRYDVIVIGGGAIGATIAWRLGQSGRTVLLLERGRVGSEASSAAAGMLGAQLEVQETGPFYQLCLESRALYREFAAELLEETGIDIELVHNGILHLAADEAQAETLRERMTWQVADGGRAQWLDAQELAAWEPALRRCAGALYLPDDSNVLPARVAAAVGRAAARRGQVVEGANVIGVETYGTGVRVRTTECAYEADHVVIAAGAWADQVLQGTGSRFGIEPVKGQLFALRPPLDVRLTRTIFADDVYLVPKRDGTVFVGATEEHGTGYDKDVTLAGLQALFRAATRVVPDLARAQFVRAWVGLRPGSTSMLPAIGPIPGAPGIFVAVGHFRNGILLTPITAEIIRSHLDGMAIPPRWQAFLPARQVLLNETTTQS